SSASGASQTTGQVVFHQYTADWTGALNLPDIVTTKINNVITAKTDFDYTYPTAVSAWGMQLPLMQVESKEHYSGSAFLSTKTKTFRADAGAQNRFFPGLVHSVTNPDGTRVSHAYLKCDIDANAKTFAYSATGSSMVEHIY